ncbi:MAG: hypothetical protein JXB04_03450 [Kiritimatiellae bacterium]|nr:hypothetical protein [Kiritimatiellia bacterium]
MHIKGYMKQGREGAALITTMIIVVVLVAAAAGVIGLSSQESYIVGRISDQIKAQAIAEAGANEAYSILKRDFSQKSNPEAFPAREFDGGTYDATVTAYDDDPTKATIMCVASYGSADVSVKCDVKDFSEAAGGGSSGPVGPYAYAIVAGSTFWAGNGPTDVGGGAVHVNGLYDMKGTTDLICGKLTSISEICSVGNATITGDAKAPVYSKKSPGNISGTAEVGAVDVVPLPGLDLAPYAAAAQVSGSGVTWIDGSVTISGGATIEGVLIATGDIHITGNSMHVPFNGMAAIISRDGDIHISSQTETHGLLYAMTGNIMLTGGGAHYGSIFCAGELKKTGSWGVVSYADSTPPADPQGGSSEPQPEVCITAWYR